MRSKRAERIGRVYEWIIYVSAVLLLPAIVVFIMHPTSVVFLYLLLVGGMLGLAMEICIVAMVLTAVIGKLHEKVKGNDDGGLQ